MNTERWAAIAGFENMYEVSDFGNVRRIGRGRGSVNGRMRHLTNHAGGYLTVSLYKDNAPRPFLVHRLVAEAFIGPIPPRHEVNHIDGNKTNNQLGNLEILTRSENILHGVRSGLIPITGENNPQSKLTNDSVLEIRRLHADGWGGYKALAKRFDISWSVIRNIVKRKTWRHL